MKWTLWIGYILVWRFSPQELVDLAMEIWPQIWERVPQEQRLEFLKDVAEKHLGVFLEDLSRPERAILINAMLPFVAREFPIVDVDIKMAIFLLAKTIREIFLHNAEEAVTPPYGK